MNADNSTSDPSEGANDLPDAIDALGLLPQRLTAGLIAISGGEGFASFSTMAGNYQNAMLENLLSLALELEGACEVVTADHLARGTA